MDVFIEQLVTKRKGAKGIALILLSIFGGIALLVAAYIFGWSIGYLELSMGLTVVIGFGMYYVISMQRVEFEYIVTNGEMDVDRIIARRTRKRIITVNCREFEDFGRYRPERFEHRSFSTRIDASSGNPDARLYFAEVNHDTKGHVLLVFEPDERTLRSIIPCLNRNISREGLL